jgi:hypothetical protein
VACRARDVNMDSSKFSKCMYSVVLVLSYHTIRRLFDISISMSVVATKICSTSTVSRIFLGSLLYIPPS